MVENILIKFLLLALLAIVGASSIQLPCPLVWKTYLLGSPLPSNVICSNTSDSQVAVITGSNRVDKTVIGHYTPSKGAFIVNTVGSVLENPSPVKILVNEHGCDIKWEKAIANNFSSLFLTRNDIKGDKYVGRFESNLAGQVDSSVRSMEYVDGGGKYKQSSDPRLFEVLLSTTSQVHLEYLDINLKSEITGDLDFVGMDDISNMGHGSTVSQTLEHRKYVTETSSFTNTQSWRTSNSVSMNLKLSSTIKVPKINKTLGVSGSIGGSYSWENSGERTEHIGREVQKTLTFARTITLPPNRRVQACTIIAKSERYSSAYTSRGKYTIKGWTGKEIQAFLGDEGCSEGMEIGSDYVTCPEEGNFEGSLYSSSLLIVVDKELETYNCSALEQNIYKLQQMKRNGITQYEEAEVLKLENYIQDMLSPKIMLPHVLTDYEK
ncbi:unnamed protein product [Allacma fusca]|uniref:Uncharacterized protein n=1 Tax=Allacma fusca TaxID=39272 RepID=A0A8J2NIT5_9HEXA|nr:unnamed protein product [Allacma fusca]